MSSEGAGVVWGTERFEKTELYSWENACDSETARNGRGEGPAVVRGDGRRGFRPRDGSSFSGCGIRELHGSYFLIQGY